jgi:hypothetical protein
LLFSLYVCQLAVEVINSFEVTLNLFSLKQLLYHVFRLYPKVKDLFNLLRRKFPELLRSECEMGHIFGFDAFFLEILSSPLDQLYAVHARHLKIDDDECDLVLVSFVEEARNCLSDGRPTVEEGSLLA